AVQPLPICTRSSCDTDPRACDSRAWVLKTVGSSRMSHLHVHEITPLEPGLICSRSAAEMVSRASARISCDVDVIEGARCSTVARMDADEPGNCNRMEDPMLIQLCCDSGTANRTHRSSGRIKLMIGVPNRVAAPASRYRAATVPSKGALMTVFERESL